MIVTVPHIEAGFVRNERGFFTQERVEGLSLRPDGAPQRQQVALDLVYASDGIAVRARENLVFAGFQALAILLQDREVAVNDRIQQRVDQIIKAGLADTATLLPDTFSYELKTISWSSFLEGQDKILAEKETKLLSFQVLA